MTTQHTPARDSVQADEFFAELHERDSMQSPKFGPVARVSDSDSTLIAFAIDSDGDESTHLVIKCSMADPDEEEATINAAVRACNAHDELVAALQTARLAIQTSEQSMQAKRQREIEALREINAALAKVQA